MSDTFKDDKGNVISDEVMERNTKCFIKALGYCIQKGYGIIVEEDSKLFIVNRLDNMIGCTRIDNLQLKDEKDREKLQPGVIIKLNEAGGE